MLANALRKCAELGKDMSTPLSWADLYRQLNVLAADLETSSDPTDSNYSLYNERRHSFSKQLDHALNARLERPPLKTRPGASISSNLPMDHMDIFTDIGGDEFTDTLIDIGPMDVVFDDWDLLPHRPFNDPEGCRLGKPLGGIVDARQEELKPTLYSSLKRMVHIDIHINIYILKVRELFLNWGKCLNNSKLRDSLSLNGQSSKQVQFPAISLLKMNLFL